MSDMLSMISRQLEPSMTIVVQTQSLHSDVPKPSTSGISTSGVGGLPSGSFQTNSWPLRSRVVQARVRARDRDALGVRDTGTAAVPAPAPVVERAGHRVALDRALGQVAAHVPAVRVEDLEVAVVACEHDEFGAEGGDGVRLAVAERLGQTEAVPAPREPVGSTPASIARTRSPPVSMTSVMVPPTVRLTGREHVTEIVAHAEAGRNSGLVSSAARPTSTRMRTCSSLNRAGRCSGAVSTTIPRPVPGRCR